MQYLLRNNSLDIISTNLPEGLIQSAITETVNFAHDTCAVTGKKRRHGTISQGGLTLYLVTYEVAATNKIFKHQLSACKTILAAYANTYERLRETESQKARRLKHNLLTYSTKINQELYKLIPQEHLSKGSQNQKDLIKRIVRNDTDKAATTFLRILKNANLIKSEFDVYDMIHGDGIEPDSFSHSIHKVISLSLSSFWLDFLQKDISVYIENCNSKLYFNYESISSILCNIFDNATKYIANKTSLNISFKENETHFFVIFDMISLRVKEEEKKRLFEEGFSSEYSEKLGYAGSGIGMSIIKKLCELNNYLIDFKVNVDPKKSTTMMSIPFDNNILSIGISKYP